MIRILLGLLPADSGICRLGGVDPAVEPLKVRSIVGYLAEDQTLYGWMTPVELCRFLAAILSYRTWKACTPPDRFEIPPATSASAGYRKVRPPLDWSLHRPSPGDCDPG